VWDRGEKSGADRAERSYNRARQRGLLKETSVAIQFTCPCGASYSVDDSQAGVLFHCEKCGLDVPVPAAAAPGAPEKAADAPP